MINRGQIEEMIDCYGADLARWPCEDKKAIADFIESDAPLSEALSVAKQLDQSVSELLMSAELEWSATAESRLIGEITQGARTTKAKEDWWRNWAGLVDQVKSLITEPPYSRGITVLLLIALFQFNFQSNEQLLEAQNKSYSVAELDDWLVFEGLAATDNLLAGLDSEALTSLERVEVEEEFEMEMIFFL